MGLGRSCTVVIKTMQVIIKTIFNLFWILISFINDSNTEENCAKWIRDLHNGVQKILIRTAHNVNFTLVSFKDCSVIIFFLSVLHINPVISLNQLVLPANWVSGGGSRALSSFSLAFSEKKSVYGDRWKIKSGLISSSISRPLVHLTEKQYG